MLRSIGKEIQLADKVIDLAIYGHPVTSMKFFRLAIERNGALNSLGKISLVLKILTVSLLLILIYVAEFSSLHEM